MLVDLKAMPMTRSSLAQPAPGPLSALRREAVREVLACAALLGGLSAAAVAASDALEPAFAMRALAVFGLACAVALHGLPAHAPHARFGAGNRVTLGRLALICALAGGIGLPLGTDADIAWTAAVVAAVAALLDAVDGPLARAGGLASAFGARFDMECDALLILVLCLLLLQGGKFGPWVLAAGLMRYAFVAAATGWHWLARPLPPSQRRKAVCALQIVSLIVCLAPVIDGATARLIAGAGLAALVFSFAADLLWLARAHHADNRESTAP